jgi:hypothetical protein
MVAGVPSDWCRTDRLGWVVGVRAGLIELRCKLVSVIGLIDLGWQDSYSFSNLKF